MEKLIPYIENLLIENDYVIIPGLGGFVIQEHSAKITPTGITPPFSAIGFNARMNYNDGLLATEILRSENISYREANKRIETKVEKIKSGLQEGKKISIGQFGHLYLNEEQQMVFTPSKEHDFIPANFGLKTLPIAKRSNNENNKKLTITLSSKNVFRYAAVILIFFGLFLTSPKIGDSEFFNQAGIYNPLAFGETTMNVQEKFTDAAEQLIEQEKEQKYHIVVACLSNAKSAQQHCELLRAKYHDNVHILPTEAHIHRVVIESFWDKEIATLYLNKIKKNNKEFKDAWIYQEAKAN